MDALTRALDAAGAPVTFWWRDEDAGRMHPRLDALLEVAGRREVPVAIATVPGWLDAATVSRLAAANSITILQHGVAHHDHAAPGDKKIELGGLADRELLRVGLVRGREQLQRAFATRFLAVLVPPWNRMAHDLAVELPSLGFRGWSGFAAEATPGPPRRVDTHLDLIRWRDRRRHATAEEAAAGLAELIVRHPGEPIGILSHHLLTGGDGIAVLDRLWGALQDHPRARVASAHDLFGEG